MLSAQVYDVIDTTRASLDEARPDSPDAVKLMPPLVGFSPAMREASAKMKRFLYRALYRHPQVMATTDAAKQVIADLFMIYRDRPGELPPDHAGTADLAAGRRHRGEAGRRRARNEGHLPARAARLG